MQNPKFPFVRDGNGLFIPILPNLGVSLPFTPGNIWHVRPRYGSDITNNGLRPESAFKSLSKAHDRATKDQNDVVLLYSEGNSVANTSAIQNSLLTWSKDLVHLIGVGSGTLLSPRSRIAFAAGYDAATDLFRVTANGCLFRNIEPVVDVGTLMTGCTRIYLGARNHFQNCHFAGMVATDIVAGSSLALDGAKENYFEDCVLGVDTKQLGAYANSQLLFTNTLGTATGYNTRNIFKRCLFNLWTNSATNAVFVRADAHPTLDRYQLFDDCLFINSHLGTALTYAFVSTDTQGEFILSGTPLLVGGASWIVGSTTQVTARPDINGATTIGIGVVVAHS